MLGIKVKQSHAEKVRLYLKKRGLLDVTHSVIRKNYFIYFPIVADADGKQAVRELSGQGAPCTVATGRFKPIGNKANYRELLRSKLGTEYETVTKGFDLLGNIAVIDCEPSIAKKVAAAVMASNKSVSTVLRKGGAVTGRYRTRQHIYVAGKKNYVATYRENGAVFCFDVRKSFFSNRLSFERGRLAGLSRGRENVMVMFAGVGPFAIELAKKNPRAKVVAIELNRKAFREMVNNIELNRVKNVEPVCGGVKKQARKYAGFADRIIMPLPKDSHSFLDSVVVAAGRKCFVHYYSFVPVQGGTEAEVSMLKRFFKTKGIGVGEIGIRTVRPYSKDTIEIVIDFRISR